MSFGAGSDISNKLANAGANLFTRTFAGDYAGADKEINQARQRLSQQPGSMSQGFQAALGNLQQIPGQLAGGMAQSVQQSPEFQRMVADPQAYTQAYAPQRPPAQPPMEEPTMVPPQATPQAQPPQPVMQAAQQAGQAMRGFGAANKAALAQAGKGKSNIQASMNEGLTSEDPEVFANTVAGFEKVRDENIVEGTPQAFFKKQIDDTYLKGTDDKGNQVYECPLTKKPCGRKTFFQRLKEFFLHSIGKKSAEEIQSSVDLLDKQDPITKNIPVEPTHEDAGQVWKSPYRLKQQSQGEDSSIVRPSPYKQPQTDTGMSGFKGAM